MTNNQLTREKVQWLHDAAEEAAAVGIKLTMNPNELLMFTSALLAAMDSEPVAWEYEEYVYVRGLGHLWREKLDCEFPGIECGTLRGVVPLYLHARPAPVMPGWIPVSEQLPEDSGRYWCYVEEQNDLGKSHYQWNCSWSGERWWVEGEDGGIVTHWMPLPAAPQEVTKDEANNLSQK